MVTKNDRISRTFSLEISQGRGDTFQVAITNRKGETRHYEISGWRLRFFTSTNVVIRDAVDFLLEENA